VSIEHPKGCFYFGEVVVLFWYMKKYNASLVLSLIIGSIFLFLSYSSDYNSYILIFPVLLILGSPLLILRVLSGVKIKVGYWDFVVAIIYSLFFIYYAEILRSDSLFSINKVVSVLLPITPIFMIIFLYFKKDKLSFGFSLGNFKSLLRIFGLLILILGAYGLALYLVY
jgi:hypothetical protein